MQTRRWVNPYQPQTMQIAIYLLYFRAVLLLVFGFSGAEKIALADLLFAGAHSWLQVVLAGAGALAGYGIANEKRAAYGLGVGVALVPIALRLYVSLRFDVGPLEYDVLGLMFDVALVALLLHPQSRDYQRIWFK